jgi:hypothetical protein
MRTSLGKPRRRVTGPDPLQPDGSWPLHRASGLSLRVPAQWRVQPGSAGDVAVADPEGRAAALVRTRTLPPTAALVPWLRQDYPATEAGLHQVRLLQVRALSSRVASMTFDYGGQLFQARACAVAVRRGRGVTVYVAAAAEERLRERLPLLAAILASARADEGPDLPAAGIDLSRLLRLGLDPPPPPRSPAPSPNPTRTTS